MLKDTKEDDLKYDKFGRLKYNTKYHAKCGEDWTIKEISYMCKMKETMTWAELSLALERTHTSCAAKYYNLKKEGMIEHYKNITC